MRHNHPSVVRFGYQRRRPGYDVSTEDGLLLGWVGRSNADGWIARPLGRELVSRHDGPIRRDRRTDAAYVLLHAVKGCQP